jgi:hypothetical protein
MSKMIIKLIIAIPIGLVVVATIFDIYNDNYLSYIFSIEKHSPPAIYKFQSEAYNDVHHYIRKMEDKYRKENKRIRKICDEYKSTVTFDFNNNYRFNEQNCVESMWVDKKHGLAYCPNANVKWLFLSILDITSHINM